MVWTSVTRASMMWVCMTGACMVNMYYVDVQDVHVVGMAWVCVTWMWSCMV